MNELEAGARLFLEKAAKGLAPSSKEHLDECLKGIKEAILNSFHVEPDTSFKLRMSNIGKDLRQLMLEKKYGREEASPEFLLKMLTGTIQEHILVYILKCAGFDIQINGEVTLAIAGKDIKGTWDVKYGKLYDVKTASEYSYKQKFASYSTLASDDSFGYIDQLIGYALAEGCEPGGWIVLNKSSGEFKVVEYPYSLDQVKEDFTKRIETKIDILENGVMPPCRGVEAETFYQKPTGNRIIGSRCRFCPHKKKCHKTATLELSRVSKAKDKPLVWYVN